MSKKVILFLVLYIQLGLHVHVNAYSTPTYYSPQDLVSITAKNKQVIDPENYLSRSDKSDKSEEILTSINSIVNNIMKEKNFETYIYIFSYISSGYGSDNDKNIELFTNDLSFLLLDKNKQRDENSMVIVFAIGDRQNRVRTGKVVRDSLQDYKLDSYLEKIKYYLKRGEYNVALLNLMTSIEGRLNTNWQIQTDIKDSIMGSLVMIALLAVVMGCSLCLGNTKKLSETAEEKLKKIKKITENGKPRREVLETLCVICLEELNANTVGNNNNANIPETANDMNKGEENRDLTEEKVFIAKLECGHSFHSKCVSEWMTKQNKCPICRENIDKEEERGNNDEKANTANTAANTNANQDSMTMSLLNIQTLLHPELRNLDYTYGRDFSWSVRPVTSTSSGSTWSSSWGEGGGGASSSW